MLKTNNEFIIEKAEDLSINKNECPISAEIQEMWIKHSTKNPILENGQMVCLNCDDEIMTKIATYFHRMLIEFIQTERNLNECYLIMKDYIVNIDNINNTSKYVKLIFDIIINMDRAYKYVWNIAKLLNDNIESYTGFTSWQKGKIKVSQEVIDNWDFIYSVRNLIEHPESLDTTFFKRNGANIITPKIIIDNKKYDLLQLGEKSLQSIFILSKGIIGASFLYSKYVVAFTDETRTKLFSPNSLKTE